MVIRELITKLGFDVDSQKLNEVESRLNNLSGTLTSFGASAINVGKRMTMFATTSIGGLATYLTKAASDAEETSAKFKHVLSDVLPEAEAMVKHLNKSYGFTKMGAEESLASTTDILQGYGFQAEEALDLAFKLQKMAADRASFQNYEGGAEGASQILLKSLLGERMQLQTALKIKLMDEDIQERINLMKQEGRLAVDVSKTRASALATYEILLERTRNSEGNYAREQQNLATQIKETQKSFVELGRELGAHFEPIAKAVLAAVKGITEWFRGLDKETQRNILGFGLLVAAAGPLIWAIGLVSTALGKLMVWKVIAFFGGLVVKLWAAAAGALGFWTALGLGFVILAALGAAFYFFGDEIIAAFKVAWDYVKAFFGWIGEKIGWLGGKIKELLGFGGSVDVNAEGGGDGKKKGSMWNPLNWFGGSEASKELMAPAKNVPNQLANAGGKVETTNNKNVKIDTNVTVNVPPGTPEQQVGMVQNAAKASFKGEYERELQRSLYENPALE